MAALQCEICGGKLIGKPGGMFECDSCGMEYSTEWARAKVQEIRGTVKIEGPVEVTGTVKVEGSGPSVEALFKRAKMAREERNWPEAKTMYDQIVAVDPENAEAYFGLLLTELRCSSDSELAETYKHMKQKPNMGRLERFAGLELKAKLECLEEQRQAELRQIEAKEESERQQRIAFLAKKRKALAPVAGVLAVDFSHALGLKADGTVAFSGRIVELDVNALEFQNKTDFVSSIVAGWRDIVAVAAGSKISVGLKSDGTVVAVEVESDGRCDVGNWTGIVAVSTDYYHTVGLKSDGTVVAVGNNDYDQCNVAGWHNIVAVAAGAYHTVGLRSDGTVVAAGNNDFGECNVAGWRDIVAVAACGRYTVGLRADGTVAFAGTIIDYDTRAWKRQNKTNYVLSILSDWIDIVAVATGGNRIVGLRSDGTVTFAGLAINHDITTQEFHDNTESELSIVTDWRNIVAVAGDSKHIMGLRSDGTVVVTGDNTFDNHDVAGWKLFNSIDTLEQERAEAKVKAEAEAEAERQRHEAERQRKQEEARRKEQARQERITELQAEKASIQAKLPTIKGLFSGGKRRELETQLLKIDEELKKL